MEDKDSNTLLTTNLALETLKKRVQSSIKSDHERYRYSPKGTALSEHRAITDSLFSRARAARQGDFNDANIVLTPDLQDVAGVIDFGDASYTWVVNDVAIAMAYAMLSPLARRDTQT